LLVLFDNKTDNGYYLWIKKPEDDGNLTFPNNLNDKAQLLNNVSLEKIVTDIKNWYLHKAA
jgi:hypothetical protein